VAVDLDLGSYSAIELFRGAGHDVETDRFQSLFDVLRCKNLDDLAAQQCNDFLGRSCWYEHANPAIALDVRIAGFSHGRDLWLDLRASFACDRERAQCARL